MAGGGGSTGGIGAQSPAVNPPTGLGQAGNAVANQIGNIGASAFGGAQQPMLQTGQFGSQPIPMGNNPAFNDPYTLFSQTPSQIPNTLRGPMGEMLPDYTNSFPAPSGFGAAAAQRMDPRMMGGEGFTPGFGQPPMETPTMDSQIRDSMQQAQAREQTLSPTQMAEMQQAFQAARQAPQQPFVFQDDQQRAPLVPQNTNAAGLMALLGGKPIQPTPTAAPTPTAPPTPTAAPTPTARPAPVAAKPVAKPSAVPPKTPPAVASAIQKLEAKKKPFGRR